jgi:lactoylglutathione lyase
VPTRLGYAILFVSDLDRAIGLYRDVIAVPLRFRVDAYAEFGTEGVKFALFPRSELPGLIGHYAPRIRRRGRRARSRSSWMTSTGSTRLQDAGVPVLAPPTDRPWGQRTLHVADPDGNVVEFTRAKQPE